MKFVHLMAAANFRVRRDSYKRQKDTERNRCEEKWANKTLADSVLNNKMWEPQRNSHDKYLSDNDNII